MKVTSMESWRERLPLTRPYTIAFNEVDSVDLHFVRLRADTGLEGLGSAAPTDITGETSEACGAALLEVGPQVVIGRDPRCLRALTGDIRAHMSAMPAARAALDMAVYDLVARDVGAPLVDLLGRRHDALPTSITIGIMPLEETLEEADEYLQRGFRCLKIKIGHDVEEDIARLHGLRERVGGHIAIRADANQGYSREEAVRMGSVARKLNVEFVEQPLPANAVDEMRGLGAGVAMAADESLHNLADALALSGKPAPFEIFNIKLMKCGGVSSGLQIAAIARAAGLDLMWGCMDESVISIAAAIHTAYACAATRFLDLDGSFDLSRDVATGGFALRDGCLHVLDAPGLGATITAAPRA